MKPTRGHRVSLRDHRPDLNEVKKGERNQNE